MTPHPPRSGRQLARNTIAALCLATGVAAGCVTDQARAPAPVVLRPTKQTYADAGAIFASRGPQPGETLQSAWVTGLDGRSVNLRDLGQGRPFVIVTASLTSPAARRSQAGLELLNQRYGESISFFTLYTVEAHPARDRSPYSGIEWVPADNIRESTLVRQPTIMVERLELAREYQRLLDVRSTMLVDPMDNVGWRTLGMGPNIAVVVDADGIVVARQGWLDPLALQATIDGMLGVAPPAPAAQVATADLPPGLAPELVEALTEQ